MIHVVLVRSSEVLEIVRDLVHLEEDLEDDGVGPADIHTEGSLGHAYADDTGIVSKSAESVAKTMTVIVTVLEAADLTVSETKTGTGVATRMHAVTISYSLL